ncbi:MAG TPA: hypothetical protein DEO85_14335 [Maritimibacter sp.]|nr:hypothetical protein [Maritimibacter sp.]
MAGDVRRELMLKNAMKTTSVLAICTALFTPAGFAQDAEEQLEECTVTGPFPCETSNGVRVENALELAKERVMPSEPDTGDSATVEPKAPAEAEAAEVPEDPVVPGEAPAEEEQSASSPGDSGNTSATENVNEDAAGAQGEAEVETDGEVAAEADGNVVTETMDEAAQAVQDPADTVAEAAENLANELEQAETDVETEAEAEQAAEAESDEMAAEAETAADAEQPAAEEDRSLVETLADEIADRVNPDEEEVSETDVPQEPVEDEAPQTAAAADEGSEDEMLEDEMVDVDGVNTVQVTEEEARSSNEEFETEVTTSANAEAGSSETTTEEGTGFNRQLTDFEKLFLVGLGGIAVGTILANGDEIVSNSGDRIVVQNPDGTYEVLKNDDIIIAQPGSQVRTRTYDDGSTRTVVLREDGTRIVTLRAADGTTIKRTRILEDGSRYVLFDDTQKAAPVTRDDLAAFDEAEKTRVSSSDERALREALMASMNQNPDRRTFSLRQVRQYESVRDLAPIIEVDAITFDTGSSVIRAGQAEELKALGTAIRDVIADVPDAVFLIEGHTDAVGDASYNLALSDRRAESVALALIEYFDVPPESLITQGYGESELKIRTADAERENRRANVRNITPLLQ